MGRSERVWGADWAEFRPERWLKRASEESEKWSFVVFQAGPRVCLGKEMAFLQMKRVVAGILSKFKVVPAGGDEFQPVYVSLLTAKMKGGFPVKIEVRDNK
ncbi:Cytochrome P450 94A2 [Linum grandiflorum]